MSSFYRNHTTDDSFSSSSETDKVSKRLSWGNLLQKLIELQHNQSLSDTSSTNGSETGSIPDISSLESDIFYDPLEEKLCAEVVDIIAQSLTDVKENVLHCCKLHIPSELLKRIGQELLHLAASEPCGLRGALVDLFVEQGDMCHSVEQIAVDPHLVPTFQLTLVLRPELRGLWPKLQKLFKAKSPSTRTLKQTLKLSAGFRVMKKKLYSSGELLIEEY